METATFAAGCFWHVEAAFRKIKGVKETTVGYSGGTTENPTYEEVCAGGTGHAEAVRVCFEAAEVSYADLLNVFWEIHDPTAVKPSRGSSDGPSQYRSVIFVSDAKQQRLAEASKEELERSGAFPAPILTQIASAGPFYRAEEYHQRYFEKQIAAASASG